MLENQSRSLTPSQGWKPWGRRSRIMGRGRTHRQPDVGVGDLPATDGMLAVELGFDFGLVLSGVTSSDQARSSFPAPHAVAANLELMVEQRLT